MACFEVTLIKCDCNETLSYLSSCLCGDKNLVLSLRKHVKSLKAALGDIKSRQEGLWRRVQGEEIKGLKRRAEVRDWLSNFRKIVPQVEDILKDSEAEIQKLCCCGYCAMKCCSSSKYSAKVLSMVEDVENLYLKGVFAEVADSYVIRKVEGIPIDPTISQEAMVEKTWKILMDDKVRCVGLFGIQGVGKSTLLSQINNEFLTRENDFEVVIRVVVPKDQKITTIQDEIGKHLDIYDEEEWMQKTENEKAFVISNSLRKMKYALLFDDMLVKVNLKKIGVPDPDPDHKKRDKIIFTTRHREVCSDMAVDDHKEVKRLDDDAAWALFQGPVGEAFFRRNPDITALARRISDKCYGLPIVINAIAQAMAPKKTVEEWEDATNSLSSIIKEQLPLSEFACEEDINLSVLKFSYINLDNDKVKRCFRYCALFPDEMMKGELIEYWECEAFAEDRDEGLRFLDKLVRARLLMENDGKVRMHDLLRKTALSLEASDGINEPQESVYVNTDTSLIQIPDDLNWSVVKRVSLINNQIKEISSSASTPNLTTLLLRNQKVEKISRDFFLDMRSLLVLDLAFNQSLAYLPANSSKLHSLRYLNLSSTNIKLLPVGLKELKLLMYLNLEHTLKLKNIAGISALLKLRVLRLLGSRFCSNLSFIQELTHLEDISVLTISISDEAVLERFVGYQHLASHTRGLSIKNFQTEADGISIVETSSCLQTLEILKSNIKEIKLGMTVTNPLPHPLFNNLSQVKLCDCIGMTHLTWLLYAPNLSILHVERAKNIEEILRREIAEGVMEREQVLPFEKLTSLVFKDLEVLKSIYWRPLPFKSLSKIFVQKCPKLKKLPLNYENAKKHKLVIDAEPDWFKNLDWEDEETRDTFSPS